MNKISGVFVAAVTPRRESGHEIDLGAAVELLDFLGQNKIDGITLLGSTGEFLHFDFDERTKLAAWAVKRSRVPVLVNVSHSTLDGAVRLAEAAAAAGASGVVLMPPYFFRYEQDDLHEFFIAFAREFTGVLPIYLYNIPFFTNELAPVTAAALLDTGRFAGIKDSSGDPAYFEAVRHSLTDGRSFFVGNDKVFTRSRQAGAHGVVSGVACAAPELMTALDHAIAAGMQPEINRLEARLQEFIARIDAMPAPIGVREAVVMRGIKMGAGYVPLGGENRRRLDEFREWFRGWLTSVQRQASA